MIDDFSICGVNSTFGLTEKLRVESIEELTASISVLLADMDRRKARQQILGRTFDMKSAYKQFGLNEEHVEKTKIALKNPDGGISFYDVLALPFGATGSVAAFLRISAAIAYVGKVGLRLAWTSYFDDFTTLAPQGQESETTFFAESLFRILGLEFAADGEKAPPFSSSFRTLGIMVDTSGWADAHVTLKHTPERSSELLKSLESFASNDSVATKSLEQLHGRLVWFKSFVFGRKLNGAVRVISKFSRFKSKYVKMSPELQSALQTLSECLTRCKPVCLSPAVRGAWLIFTDGAYEPANVNPGSIGGVLVNPDGIVASYFGISIPPKLMAEFLEESSHPIYELEIFPLVIALRLWASVLRDGLLVHYLDNNAALSSFIRADAGTSLGRALIEEYVRLEGVCNVAPWFSRVTTSSNIADEPSRLCFSNPLFQGAERKAVVLPVRLSEWGILRAHSKWIPASFSFGCIMSSNYIGNFDACWNHVPTFVLPHRLELEAPHREKEWNESWCACLSFHVVALLFLYLFLSLALL